MRAARQAPRHWRDCQCVRKHGPRGRRRSRAPPTALHPTDAGPWARGGQVWGTMGGPPANRATEESRCSPQGSAGNERWTPERQREICCQQPASAAVGLAGVTSAERAGDPRAGDPGNRRRRGPRRAAGGVPSSSLGQRLTARGPPTPPAVGVRNSVRASSTHNTGRRWVWPRPKPSRATLTVNHSPCMVISTSLSLSSRSKWKACNCNLSLNVITRRKSLYVWNGTPCSDRTLTCVWTDTETPFPSFAAHRQNHSSPFV